MTERKKRKARRTYKSGVRKTVMEITLACGCLPYRQLALTGLNVKTVQKKIREMQEEGVVEIYHKNKVWLVVIKEFSKKSHEYAEEMGSRLMKYYEVYGSSDSKRARYANDWESIRVIRNAESYMFMYGIGIKCVLGEKTSLRDEKREIKNSYYTAREIKGYNGYHADLDKDRLLSTTRINGMVVSDGGVYTVYNMGESILSFNRTGEKKIEVYINKAMAIKGLSKIKGAVVLGKSEKVFADMIIPRTRKVMEQLSNMEGVYEHVYGIPMTEEGQAMMRLLKEPDWDERIYQTILRPEWRAGRTGTVDCDGQDGEVYYFCYCVPDVKRLKMFLRRAELECNRDKYQIICFDIQVPLVTRVVGNYARVKSVAFKKYLELIS